MTRGKTILLLLIGLMLTTACNFPLLAQNNGDEVEDAVSETIQAVVNMTQAASVSTVAPTWTVQPTYTPFPTQQYIPPPKNTPQPCNQAIFVSETVKDGTVFLPGDNFTKSWRLKNTGTCTWNPDYTLDFYSGDRMSGPKSQDLDEYVKPGETVDIVIDLEAPEDPDTYRGYWKLEDDEGEPFYQVYAEIEVADLFAVTSVSLDADPNPSSGACPATITVEADITASSAGKVTYKWVRSDGVTSDLKSVRFSEADTKTVSFDWDIDEAGDYTVSIYIDKPNHQTFGPLEISVTCDVEEE